MTKRLLIMLTTGFLILMAPGTIAQDDTPPDDPDCEDDPNQAGCDPECAGPDVDCHHPPCPTNLAGQAVPDTEQIFMSWTLNSLDDINVYRAEGGGEFELIDTLEFPATKYIDHDAEAGTTYRYQVTAINETGVESPACETLEITAIPVFPTTVAMLGATSLAVVAYAGFRRRH